MKQVGFDTKVLVFEKNDTKCTKLPYEFPTNKYNCHKMWENFLKKCKISTKCAKSALNAKNHDKMRRK